MSADPRRRVDPDGVSAAEALLREARIDGQAEKNALAELFAAATAPARDHELVGERSALAAFREARQSAETRKAGAARQAGAAEPTTAHVPRPDTPAVPPRAARAPVRRPRRRAVKLRLRAVRAATLGLATATAAGVAAIAFAAGTGDLPAALRGDDVVRGERTPSASAVPPPSSPYDVGPNASAEADTVGPGSKPGSRSPADGGAGGTDGAGETGGGPGGDETYRGPGPHPSDPNSPLVNPEDGAAEPGESSLRRLCREYLRDEPMSKRDTRRLAKAAGGSKKVRGYCTRKLDTETGEEGGAGEGPDGPSGDTNDKEEGEGESGADSGSESSERNAPDDESPQDGQSDENN